MGLVFDMHIHRSRYDGKFQQLIHHGMDPELADYIRKKRFVEGVCVALEVDVDRGMLTVEHAVPDPDDRFAPHFTKAVLAGPWSSLGAKGGLRQVIAHPDMVGTDGRPQQPLEPPLRWAAGCGFGTTVRVSDSRGPAARSAPEGPPATAELRQGGRSAAGVDMHIGACTSAADLPPVSLAVVPPKVIARVCSFLSTKDLGRLACVLRRFTERSLRDPDGGPKVSPIEEGARLAAMGHPNALEMGSLVAEHFLAGENEPWLRLLWKLEGGWSRRLEQEEAADAARVEKDR